MPVPPFMGSLRASGPPPIESLTISSIDTGITGYPFFVMSGNPSTAGVGDRLVQGGASTYITGIINNLVFVVSSAGFSAGSVSAYDDTGGTAIDWAVFDVSLIGNLDLHYKSDAGITLVGSKVSQWDNLGLLSSCNVTQSTDANRPTYTAANSNYNNYPSLTCNGSSTFLKTTTTFTPGTAAEVFMVLNVVADPPPGVVPTGSITLGPTSVVNYYPYNADSHIYTAFLSSASKDCGNPTPSLTAPHCFNVVSTTAEYTAFLNGTQIFTTGTNTMAGTSGIRIGTGSGFESTFLNGDFVHLLYFAKKLSANYKTVLNKYVQTRYSIDMAGV